MSQKEFSGTAFAEECSRNENVVPETQQHTPSLKNSMNIKFDLSSYWSTFITVKSM